MAGASDVNANTDGRVGMVWYDIYGMVWYGMVMVWQ